MAGELLSLSSTISADSAAFVRGVENCRGGLRNLISSLDPVAASTLRFNRNMETLDRALKQGKISADDYATYVGRLRGRMDEVGAGQQRLGASTGQLRAGMQQLSYQLGDISQGFAMNVSPMTIFAQQSGQVIQAVGLMTNSTKGFIAFLAGPWGAVLTGAVTILGAMAVNHSKAASAQDEHTKSADRLKAAIERLKNESAAANRETRQGILDSIDAANADRKAANEKLRRVQAELRFAESARRSAMVSTNVEGLDQAALLGLRSSGLKSELAAIEGEIKTFSSNITLDRVKLAMRDVAGETNKTTKVTQDYEDAIDRVKRRFEAGGFGDPNSASADAQLRAQLTRATQARDAAIEAIQAAERAQSEAERSGKAADKRAASEAKREAQKAAREAEKLARDTKKATEELKQSADSAWAAMFPSEERLRGLYAQMRSVDEAMVAQLIDPKRWSATKARLNEEISALREQLDKEAKTFAILGEGENATVIRELKLPDGPDIKNLSKSISEQLQGVAKSAADAGAAFVTMSENALNSLSNLANSIKSGNVLNILADAFNMFGSLSQAGIFGKGLAGSFKDFRGISGFRANGGPVSGGSTYVVGERGPELFVPNRSGYIVPNGANDNSAGRRGGNSFYFDNRGAVMTQDLLQQMNAIGGDAAMRGAVGGSMMAQDNVARKSSRRMPGR